MARVWWHDGPEPELPEQPRVELPEPPMPLGLVASIALAVSTAVADWRAGRDR